MKLVKEYKKDFIFFDHKALMAYGSEIAEPKTNLNVSVTSKIKDKFHDAWLNYQIKNRGKTQSDFMNDLLDKFMNDTISAFL